MSGIVVLILLGHASSRNFPCGNFFTEMVYKATCFYSDLKKEITQIQIFGVSGRPQIISLQGSHLSQSKHEHQRFFLWCSDITSICQNLETKLKGRPWGLLKKGAYIFFKKSICWMLLEIRIECIIWDATGGHRSFLRFQSLPIPSSNSLKQHISVLDWQQVTKMPDLPSGPWHLSGLVSEETNK